MKPSLTALDPAPLIIPTFKPLFVATLSSIDIWGMKDSSTIWRNGFNEDRQGKKPADLSKSGKETKKWWLSPIPSRRGTRPPWSPLAENTEIYGFLSPDRGATIQNIVGNHGQFF